MNTPIRIALPAHLSEDEWKQCLDARLDEFKAALDLSVGVEADNSQAIIRGIRIETLALHEDKLRLGYSIDWSIHYGCEDLSVAGVQRHHVVAARQGNVLWFTPFVCPEPRSTLDEF